MGWDLLAWLFGEEEEDGAPPEPLVLGAELRCPHGSESSYLIVMAENIDINNLPQACVLDCKAFENIMPFGRCRCGGTCEEHMKLDKKWENPEPQKTLVNGAEIITTKSTLICNKIGVCIEAVTSGQDGESGKQIAEWMKLLFEIEEKYPGLTGILLDPYGSLYLSTGMYQKAIQFLEDYIEKNGGELELAILYADDDPEIQLVKVALDQLILAFDAERPENYLGVLEACGSRTGMYVVPGWDAHLLNKQMIDMLKADCANTSKKIETNALARWTEKHKKGLRIFGKKVQDIGYTCVLLASTTKTQKENVGESIPDLSNKAIKHAMNDHMPVKYAKQLQYLSKESAEQYLSYKTFFNPYWTDEQVRAALNLGYKEAICCGVSTGKYSYVYLGNNITIYLEQGIFKTGYGDFVYTYDEILKLLGG